MERWLPSPYQLGAHRSDEELDLFRYSVCPHRSAIYGVQRGGQVGITEHELWPGWRSQYIFADQIGGAASCGASAAKVTSTGLAAAPCMALADFPDPTTAFGNQMRNQNRGPGYFNTDFALEKAFGIPKWEGAQFSLGARFFNIFNHPNFGFPVMNNRSLQFGQIIQTVSS